MQQGTSWIARHAEALWSARWPGWLRDLSAPSRPLVLAICLMLLVLPVFAPATHLARAASYVSSEPRLLDDRDVLTFRISPNSRYVVYQVGSDIYSIALGGGSPVELTVAPATYGGDFLISPDSSRVVFRGNNPGDAKAALFSVLLTGGTPIQLNAPLANEAYVTLYRISLNSQRVVYDAEQSPGGSRLAPREIYSVPITGGNPVKLNLPLIENQRIESEQISSDSQYVVYELNPGIFSTEPHSLYRVSLTGGESVKIDDAFAAQRGDSFNAYLISPDSTHVVYPRTQPSTEPTALYAAPLAGGAPFKLDSPAGVSVEPFTLAITPDSRRVIFKAGTSYYSTLLNGSGSAIDLAPIAGSTNITESQLSPDGTYFVYAGRTGTDYRVNIVPITGGETITYIGGDTGTSAFGISPDSQRVVYLVGGQELDSQQLYSASMAGGHPLPIGEPVLFPGQIVAHNELEFTPDGSQLIYRTRKTLDGRYDLLITSVEATEQSVKLNGSVMTVAGTAAEPLSFLLTPDGSNVVFRGGADPDQFAPRQLYVTALRETSISVFLPLVQR